MNLMHILENCAYAEVCPNPGNNGWWAGSVKFSWEHEEMISTYLRWLALRLYNQLWRLELTAVDGPGLACAKLSTKFGFACHK